MYLIAQNIGIHTVSVLVDAQTQPAAHFLALANLTAALLQGTDLEHIGVVPTFPQGGVREDKAHRGFFRITIQQQFLVFHNQVIGVNIVGGLFLFVS